MKIKVTARVTYDYDTDDGVVDSVETALEDVSEMISTGDISAAQFEYVTQVACAYCEEFNMDTEACPNAKDLCLDCCGEEH